ncbi:MAG: AMP-binding protein, partial [Solirubrobacterales bacterium]
MSDRFDAIAKRISIGPLGPVTDIPFNLRTLAEAGVFRPVRPDKLARTVRELLRWGASPAAGIAGAAINHPHEVALCDDAGELTFSDLDRRSNALANALAQRGVGEGEGVAIMCRNHRGFIDATLAVSKLGAHGLYLNTAFSGPQLEGVMEREQPVALIYDDEFAGLLGDADADTDAKRFVAWSTGGSSGSHTTLDELISSAPEGPPAAPDESARFVILTSGTTGTPKGAQRGQPDTLGPLAAMFSRIPLHARETTVIAAPLFHSWGFAHFMLGLALSSTYVVQRKFDPEQTLKAIASHQATALVVVPVMMQRILQLPAETLSSYELPSLRVTAASGSALPGPLAEEWMDRFGDNLYNLYGSTEVAWATIATPEDMRAAPGTAGRPPRGTVVRIVDEEGSEQEPGTTGRIFVGNEMAFEGYTGGDDKERLDELLSTGDVGHFDSDGRLFIDGRDDEMIVSGGENVFPREVEDLLADHEAVAEVAAIGVGDEKFGQRLKAFVVTQDGKDVSEDELKSHVKQNLAGYKVPREVVFIDELPRNATGKVLKRDLAGEAPE